MIYSQIGYISLRISSLVAVPGGFAGRGRLLAGPNEAYWEPRKDEGLFTNKLPGQYPDILIFFGSPLN